MSHPEKVGQDLNTTLTCEPAPAAALLNLAVECETAGFGQQELCVTTSQRLLAGYLARRCPGVAHELLTRCADFIQAGAFESAVLALIPPEAVFTTGRLSDASVIAQIQLTPGSGAHSRRARWLAMALLAALLRAFAAEDRQCGETPEAA